MKSKLMILGMVVGLGCGSVSFAEDTSANLDEAIQQAQAELENAVENEYVEPPQVNATKTQEKMVTVNKTDTNQPSNE